MGATDRWKARGATVEAMAVLALARVLVARVRFDCWRGSLGEAVVPPPQDVGLRHDGNLAARRWARAVERAARRLPGVSKCLPQAMALQWLLRRRRIGAVLLIGVRPGYARGGLDDLHAWVVRDGEILIGGDEVVHHPLFAFQPATGKSDCRART